MKQLRIDHWFMVGVCLTGLAFVLALGFVGESDYNRQAEEFAHYCEMVENGVWPDYQKAGDKCDEINQRPQ